MEGTGRYEIVELLARGDFAAVYRARDRELGRGVAIKQIHQQFLADGRQLARYWQEAQLLASLQHPNILTIYDIVRSQGLAHSGTDARQPAAARPGRRHRSGLLAARAGGLPERLAIPSRPRRDPRRHQAQ